MEFLNLNIYSILALVESIVYFVLACFVYCKVPQRTPQAKRFVAFCLLYAIYTAALVAQFVMFPKSQSVAENVRPLQAILFSVHLSSITGTLIPLVYADFLFSFANRRPKWYRVFYGVIYGVGAGLASFFVYWEQSNASAGKWLAGGTHFYPPLIESMPLIVMSLFAVPLIGALVSLELSRRRTDSPSKRQMFGALLIASGLVIPAAFADSGFMVQNKGFPLSFIVAPIYASYFTYAIIRHRFLGIRVVSSRKIIYAILTALFISFIPMALIEVPLPFVLVWGAVVATAMYFLIAKLEGFLRDAEQFKWYLVRQFSHDLNTPLTSIKMIVNTLRRKIGEDPQAQEGIKIVMGEFDRLEHLIDNLDLIADEEQVSGALPIVRERVDLGALVAEVVALFELQASAQKVTLSYQPPPEPCTILGDPDRLKQVLINLVSNSIKYNRLRGSVDIFVTQNAGRVEVSVSDTGTGMSDADINAVFKPFYRSERVKATGIGGIGLGLAIVKQIVEEHHGTIDVYSELNQGTTVRFSIEERQTSSTQQSNIEH
jgi:signal transduction histidine kinase